MLTTPDAAWDLAVRTASVIGRRPPATTSGWLRRRRRGKLGVSRRQVFALIRRWRSGEGVVSDLLPGRSNDRRDSERLPEGAEAIAAEVLCIRYLTRRRPVAAVHWEIVRRCLMLGLACRRRKR